MSVQVSHKGRKLEIPLSATDTLGDLLARCSKETGVPADRIKLLASGDSPALKRKRPENAADDRDAIGDFFGSIKSTVSEWFGGGGGVEPANNTIKRNQSMPQRTTSRPDLMTRVNVLGQEDFKGSYVMMKDHSASLQHYGIKNGSKIMMLGDVETRPSVTKQAPTGPIPSGPTGSSSSIHTMTPEEAALHKLSEIDATLTSQTIPLVEEYMTTAIDYTSQLPSETTSLDAVQKKKVKDAHARVSELILQVLLKVDGVKVPEGDEVVRMRRKECVKKCNALLDRVDSMKEKVKEFEAAFNSSL
ncbi:hypothetical protein BDR26DRAFT_929874 [Obelidium mucronatum]|nr:hypothetical protein BDR26DRAFT_929874 [Obelidium mucronatum]